MNFCYHYVISLTIQHKQTPVAVVFRNRSQDIIASCAGLVLIVARTILNRIDCGCLPYNIVFYLETKSPSIVSNLRSGI